MYTGYYLYNHELDCSNKTGIGCFPSSVQSGPTQSPVKGCYFPFLQTLDTNHLNVLTTKCINKTGNLLKTANAC